MELLIREGKGLAVIIQRACLLLIGLVCACASSVQAQCCTQAYRLVCKTIYDEQQVTAYRVQCETVYDESQVTVHKPVWETQARVHRYTVARPVTETTERIERYTVQRPVWETHERDVCYTVRRQVTDTIEKEVVSTVMKPVTTCQTRYVDQGGYVDQQSVVAGSVSNRLRWMPGGMVTDPVTGAAYRQRAGLVWVPQAGPSKVVVNRVWQPNVVAQQIPVTQLVPEQIVTKVPVQVCRYVDEQVTKKVPYQVCRMETQVCERKVPVTTCKIVYENREEPISVRVCKMVSTTETVRTPRVVEKRIPVTYTVRTPRTVVMRIPLDPCGAPTCSTCSPSSYYTPAPSQQAAPSSSGMPKPAMTPEEAQGASARNVEKQPTEAEEPAAANGRNPGPAAPMEMDEAGQPDGARTSEPEKDAFETDRGT